MKAMWIFLKDDREIKKKKISLFMSEECTFIIVQMQ